MPPWAERFLRRHRIDPRWPEPRRAAAVARAFARLPYENFTKIIAEERAVLRTEARRTPAEVLADHEEYGTGGTCFSLTDTLVALLRAVALRAEPILADRWYGANTHCAVLVWLEGTPHLLDPGFLLTEPLPLPRQEAISVPTALHTLHLQPRSDGRVELLTEAAGRRKSRLLYRPEPADLQPFLSVWDDSFTWEMMKYPLVAGWHASTQVYLRGTRLQLHGPRGRDCEELPPSQLPIAVERLLGVAPEITQQALSIWARRGEHLHADLPG